MAFIVRNLPDDLTEMLDIEAEVLEISRNILIGKILKNHTIGSAEKRKHRLFALYDYQSDEIIDVRKMSRDEVLRLNLFLEPDNKTKIWVPKGKLK